MTSDANVIYFIKLGPFIAIEANGNLQMVSDSSLGLTLEIKKTKGKLLAIRRTRKFNKWTYLNSIKQLNFRLIPSSAIIGS